MCSGPSSSMIAVPGCDDVADRLAADARLELRDQVRGKTGRKCRERAIQDHAHQLPMPGTESLPDDRSAIRPYAAVGSDVGACGSGTIRDRPIAASFGMFRGTAARCCRACCCPGPRTARHRAIRRCRRCRARLRWRAKTRGRLLLSAPSAAVKGDGKRSNSARCAACEWSRWRA